MRRPFANPLNQVFYNYVAHKYLPKTRKSAICTINFDIVSETIVEVYLTKASPGIYRYTN